MTRKLIYVMSALALAVSGLTAAPAAAQATEGIGVRGEWVIEVRNPDGSVASRRTFHNALTDAGKGQLAQVLAGEAAFSPDSWGIVLFADDIYMSPFNSDPPGYSTWGLITKRLARGPCDEDSSAGGGLPVFCNLQVTRSGTSLILTGSAKAFRMGLVYRVATMHRVPNAIFLSDHYFPDLESRFTETLIKSDGVVSPVRLDPGQIVVVTVTISFATAAPVAPPS